MEYPLWEQLHFVSKIKIIIKKKQIYEN